jgi:hypothetical protein
MADRSLPDPLREDLRRQIFRAILDALKQLPSYKHSAFVSTILSELIESDTQPLQPLIDSIDTARMKVGAQ